MNTPKEDFAEAVDKLVGFSRLAPMMAKPAINAALAALQAIDARLNALEKATKPE